jgi:hypothetical protein
MDKNLLFDCVERNLSSRDIAKATGKSQTVVRYWLKRFGIKTNRKLHNVGGNPSVEAFCCMVCGEKDRSRFYIRKNRKKNSRCKTCHNHLAVERFRATKKRAVEYKGGECQKCGYNKNYAALDFHHTDPMQKDINFKTSRHWGWERLKKELDKCEILCRNCHAEFHHPEQGVA